MSEIADVTIDVLFVTGIHFITISTQTYVGVCFTFDLYLLYIVLFSYYISQYLI